MKNFGEFFKFLCKCFINFIKILQRSLMSSFVLNWNIGDAISVQDLREIHLWNFFRCFSLEPKFWRRNCIQYILYICHLCPPNFYTWWTPCYQLLFRITIVFNYGWIGSPLLKVELLSSTFINIYFIYTFIYNWYIRTQIYIYMKLNDTIGNSRKNAMYNRKRWARGVDKTEMR